MTNSRWITLLAAGLLAATACNDSTAPVSNPGSLTPSAPLQPVAITLNGTISKAGRDPLRGLVLTLEDGTQIPLTISAESYALSNLDGAGVEIHGVWIIDQSFQVSTFVVRQIDGNSVLDGVLAEERLVDVGDGTSVSYFFQLTDGSYRPTITPSPEMLEHPMARMWVRIDENANVIEFGMIGG